MLNFSSFNNWERLKNVDVSEKFKVALDNTPQLMPSPDRPGIGKLTEEEGEWFIDGHNWNLMMHSFTCELNLQRQGLNLEGGRLYAN